MTFDIRVWPSPSTKDATRREGTQMLTDQQQCSQSTYLFYNLNTSTEKKSESSLVIRMSGYERFS